MSKTSSLKPMSTFGQELQDLIAVLEAIGATREEIKAAVLGRAGVNSSCWTIFVEAEVKRRTPLTA